MRRVFAIGLFIAFAPPVLLAQSGRPYSPPRTPDGHPDLQGLWDVSTITPVERPQGLPAVLTGEQARQQEKQQSNRVANAARPSNPARSAPPAGANVGTYNNFWIDRGSEVIVVNGERRSSLIVDPADGRVPALTDEAQRRNAGRRGTAQRPTSDAIEKTGEYPRVVSDSTLYEYACHESNYALEGILRGARLLENEGAGPRR